PSGPGPATTSSGQAVPSRPGPVRPCRRELVLARPGPGTTSCGQGPVPVRPCRRELVLARAGFGTTWSGVGRGVSWAGAVSFWVGLGGVGGGEVGFGALAAVPESPGAQAVVAGDVRDTLAGDAGTGDQAGVVRPDYAVGDRVRENLGQLD